MDLIVNGDSMKIPEDVKTIEQLVAYMKLQSPVIIAEQNGAILKQEEHAAAHVTNGDKIELVQFVGGG